MTDRLRAKLAVGGKRKWRIKVWVGEEWQPVQQMVHRHIFLMCGVVVKITPAESIEIEE